MADGLPGLEAQNCSFLSVLVWFLYLHLLRGVNTRTSISLWPHQKDCLTVESSQYSYAPHLPLLEVRNMPQRNTSDNCCVMLEVARLSSVFYSSVKHTRTQCHMNALPRTVVQETVVLSTMECRRGGDTTHFCSWGSGVIAGGPLGS